MNIIKYKLIIVAGARPNFMKIAPLLHALENNELIEPILVHTGQHYDEKMSDLFFRQLNIPAPKINLEVGSASHAVQTARIMEAFEKVCLDVGPDMVLVVGDVNSTLACTLVASKLGITTCHYEAGLRSRDRSMPEEINRLATDAITDLFFTTSFDADENLMNEGIPQNKIHMVGNLMIDSLVANLDKIQDVQLVFPQINRAENLTIGQQVQSGNYGLMTFHRPANVDNPESLSVLVDIWLKIAEKIPLIFPIHPRTFKQLGSFGLAEKIEACPQLYLIEPLGYLEFIALVRNSKFVLTDSGGVQEETTFLKIPCLTVRNSTERPITVLEGSNKLIKPESALIEIEEILEGTFKESSIPVFWEGHAATRIVRILEEIAASRRQALRFLSINN